MSVKTESYLAANGFNIYRSLDRELLSPEDIDVIWSGVRVRIDSKYLREYTKVKFLCFPTTGLSHLHLEQSQTDFVILSLKDKVDSLKDITSTAELTLLFILNSLRNVYEAYGDVKNGHWRRQNFIGHSIRSKRIGVLGLGRLGSKIADVLSNFGAKIYYCDPMVVDPKYSRMDCQELFKFCDLITVHVQLNSETIKLISSSLLESTKPNLILVNSSRGELIDSNALTKWLDEYPTRQYYTDVLEAEESFVDGNVSMKQKEFLSRTNVFATPHIGGACYDNFDKTQSIIAEALVKAVRS